MKNLRLFIKALRLRIQDMRYDRRPPSKWHKSLLLYPFRLLLHPIDTFNDLKYENKGSMIIANVMAALFVLVRLLEQTSMGYLFGSPNASQTGIFTVLAISLGVLLIFTICNWATCTLLDGEGRMGDVWMVMTYSTLPYLFCSSIAIILSHLLTNTEVMFFTFFQTLGTLWMILLVFLGLLVVHQYSVFKTILSVLATLLILLCFVFLLLLFLSIYQQVYDFILNIFRELVIRNV